MTPEPDFNFPLKLANFLINVPSKTRDFITEAVPVGLITMLICKIEVGDISKKDVLKALATSRDLWEKENKEILQRLYDQYPIGSKWELKSEVQPRHYDTSDVYTIQSLYTDDIWGDLMVVLSSERYKSIRHMRAEMLTPHRSVMIENL